MTLKKGIKRIKTTIAKNSAYSDDEVKEIFLSVFVTKYLRDNDRMMWKGTEGQQTRCLLFTLRKMMEKWKGRPLTEEEDWGIGRPIVVSEELRHDMDAFVEGPAFFKGAGSSIIGETFASIFPLEDRKKRGVFYTPPDMARFMVEMDGLQWREGKVLDPACGSGVLLSAAYDAMRHNDTHRHVLQRLWGVDLDPYAVRITRLVLMLKGDRYLYPPNIRCQDSLWGLDSWLGKFDCVLANPPYMGHKFIPADYMERLRKAYGQVYGDKGDLSYCFFMRADQLLKEDGEMVFLTSRYFLEALNGKGLRNYLAENFSVCSVVDCNGWRPINSVGIDPVILHLKKVKTAAQINVQKCQTIPTASAYKKKGLAQICELEEKYFLNYCVDSQALSEKPWKLIHPKAKAVLEKINEKTKIMLDDVAESFQGVITGRDGVFVMTEEKARARSIPARYLQPWIKNSQVRDFQIGDPTLRLLKPDNVEDLSLEPDLVQYLTPFKEKLKGRREYQSGRIKWYGLQWPRREEAFEGSKIVFPYKAEKNRFALDERGCYFSADIYGLVSEVIPLKALVVLLNSSLYEFYYKTFAKKLGGYLYEYYPHSLMQLKMPESDSGIYCQLENLYDIIIYSKGTDYSGRRRADCLLFDFFDLSEEERRFVGTLNGKQTR